MENKITLWETKFWCVYLAEDQTYLGRAVVVLKRKPCTSLTDLLDEELLDLQHEVIRPFEAAVKKCFGAELFNWSCLMNLAYQNTPPDPHVHWHVKPRYRNPVEVAGERFVDEKFGYHYTSDSTRILSGEVRNEIAKRIWDAMK